MSQKSEKYARRVERRVARLEERMEQISHDVTNQGVRVSTAEELLEVMAVPTHVVNTMPDYTALVPPPAVYRASSPEHRAKRAAAHARRKREVRHQVAGLCLTILGIFLMVIALVRAKTASGTAEVPALPAAAITAPVAPDAAALPEAGRPAGPAVSVKP